MRGAKGLKGGGTRGNSKLPRVGFQNQATTVVRLPLLSGFVGHIIENSEGFRSVLWISDGNENPIQILICGSRRCPEAACLRSRRGRTLSPYSCCDTSFLGSWALLSDRQRETPLQAGY